MDEQQPLVQNKIDILIKDGKIFKIGKNIKYEGDNIKIIKGKNKIAIPGLINCHTHIPMGLFKEIIDGKKLQNWLEESIWPLENKMNDKDIYYFTKLSLLECLENGTSFINDMYFKDDIIINVMDEVGIDGITTCTLMDADSKEKGEERLNNFINLVKKFPDKKISLSIHGLYTASPEYIEKCISVAKELGIKILHLHFCENDDEVKIIKDKHKTATPTSVLLKYFKDFKIVLAHGVSLTKKDISNLKQLDCSIAHNPLSNMRLGCGVAKIHELLKNNINVCLGTDGQGSGSNLSLLESARMACLLQKGINKDPCIINSYDVLKMATINGAKALGKEETKGTISIGKDADLILFKFKSAQLFPINDIISDIVYNANSSDIDYLISRGNILIKHGKHINIKKYKLIKKCQKLLEEIKKR